MSYAGIDDAQQETQVCVIEKSAALNAFHHRESLGINELRGRWVLVGREEWCGV